MELAYVYITCFLSTGLETGTLDFGDSLSKKISSCIIVSFILLFVTKERLITVHSFVRRQMGI